MREFEVVGYIRHQGRRRHQRIGFDKTDPEIAESELLEDEQVAHNRYDAVATSKKGKFDAFGNQPVQSVIGRRDFGFHQRGSKFEVICLS